MATFNKVTFDLWLAEAEKRDPDYNQFREEWWRHRDEWYKLNREVLELQSQKERAGDEDSRKNIDQQIQLKSTERDLTSSKQDKAHSQWEQRSSELWREKLLQELKTADNDVLKGEIERRLQAAESDIHRLSENVKKYESEAAGHESRLGLLKKEARQAQELMTRHKEFEATVADFLQSVDDLDVRCDGLKDNGQSNPVHIRERIETTMSLEKECISLEPKLHEIKAGYELLMELSQTKVGGQGKDEVLLGKEKAEKCYQDLCDKICYKKRLLDAQLSNAQAFHGAFEDFVTWLRQTERKIQSDNPLKLEGRELRIGLNNLKAIADDVSAQESVFEGVCAKHQELMEHGFEDAEELQLKLDNAQQKWNAIQIVNVDIEVIKETIAKLEAFYSSYDKISSEVDNLLEKLSGLTTKNKDLQELEKVLNEQQLKFRNLLATCDLLQTPFDQSHFQKDVNELQEKLTRCDKERDELLKIDTNEMTKVEKEGGPSLYETQQTGYTCAAHSKIGFVYVPNTISQSLNIDIQSTGDVSFHPKTTANEVILTPVVSITPHSHLEVLTKDQPVIIELMKTAQPLDIGDIKVLPMFSDTDESVPPDWKELDEGCEVLEDRVRFKTSHFSFFTVIARFPPPAASIKVDPSISDAEGAFQLTVPELPRFKVEIPSKSVQSATEVKATLHYDDSEMCKSSSDKPLASACVALEPHGQRFLEKISVQIPIPGYSEITKSNPHTMPQLLYSHSGSSTHQWIPYDDVKIEEVEGDFVAKVFVDHFSWWKIVWSEPVAGITEAVGTMFKHVRSLGGRCQVFMTEIGSTKSFGLQVLVYPFRDPPNNIPDNYDYALLDSGSYPIRFTPGKLQLLVAKEGKVLSTQSVQFSGKYARTADFQIFEEPKEGMLAQLFILCHDDTSCEHKFNLIKKAQRKPGTPLPKTEPTIHLPSLTSEDTLDEKAFRQILECLWPVRDKWHQIGVTLNIDATTLKVIKKDNPYCVDDCISSMLDIWLRNGNPCWKVLAEALRSHLVGVTVEEDGKKDVRKNDTQEKYDEESHKDLETMNENGTRYVHDENFQGDGGNIGKDDLKSDASNTPHNVGTPVEHDDQVVVRSSPCTGASRPVSRWLYFSLLPLGGFVAIALVWFLRRWRK